MPTESENYKPPPTSQRPMHAPHGNAEHAWAYGIKWQRTFIAPRTTPNNICILRCISTMHSAQYTNKHELFLQFQQLALKAQKQELIHNKIRLHSIICNKKTQNESQQNFIYIEISHACKYYKEILRKKDTNIIASTNKITHTKQ